MINRRLNLLLTVLLILLVSIVGTAKATIVTKIESTIPTQDVYFEQYITGTEYLHLKQIYHMCVSLGGHPDVFSKVGASTTGAFENLHYIGIDEYLNLGNYQYLMPTVEFYKQTPVYSTTPNYGGWQNSFRRSSLAATGGIASASLLSTGPHPVNMYGCVGVTPLSCEYDEAHPCVALVHIGTNDWRSNYQTSPATFRSNLEAIVDYTLGRRIIPILSTLQRRCDVNPKPTCYSVHQEYNEIIREVAADKRVPLIDLALALESLSNWGLTDDWVHLSQPLREYTATFTDAYMIYGYNWFNLLQLGALHKLRENLQSTGPCWYCPEPICPLGEVCNNPAD